MNYIKNAKIDLDFKHIFCKMENIDNDIIQACGRGIMTRCDIANISYLVYRYGDFVIFPE